jgi:cofilin
MDAYEGIKFRKETRWVIYKIKNLQVIVDKTGDRKEQHEDFIKKLPGSNCRFALYDLETQEALGKKTSKLYFVMWSPENANDQDRVTYTQALPIFKEKLSGIVSLNASEQEDIEAIFSKEKQHTED